MQITLNQALWLVLTVAAVVALAFLARLFLQLSRTAREAQKAMVEATALLHNLQETERKVSLAVEDLAGTIQATRKMTESASRIAMFVTAKVIRPSSKWWPFLFPLLRMGWQKFKKRKEK
jgi:competence protein ComGC